MSRGEHDQPRPSGTLLQFPVERTLPRGEKRRYATPTDVGTVLVYRYYTEAGNNYSIHPRMAETFLAEMYVISSRYGLPTHLGVEDDLGKTREVLFFEHPSEDEQQFCSIISLAEDGKPTSVSFRKIKHEETVAEIPEGRRLHIVQDE